MSLLEPVAPVSAGATVDLDSLTDRELLLTIAGQNAQIVALLSQLANAAGQVTTMIESGGLSGILGGLFRSGR